MTILWVGAQRVKIFCSKQLYTKEKLYLKDIQQCILEDVFKIYEGEIETTLKLAIPQSFTYHANEKA